MGTADGKAGGFLAPGGLRLRSGLSGGGEGATQDRVTIQFWCEQQSGTGQTLCYPSDRFLFFLDRAVSVKTFSLDFACRSKKTEEQFPGTKWDAT